MAGCSNEKTGTCSTKQCVLGSLHGGPLRPHEPSPRPGKQIHRDTVTYFLVLSIRPDRTAETVHMAVQTEDGDPGAPEPQPAAADRPLLYAALLSTKAEATEAIKVVLAKVNDDHGNLPHTLFFRLHSDRGG